MDKKYPPFLDLTPEMRDPETARYRILPVPFDATSTFRKGADRGPEELLAVTDQLEEYDIETGLDPCRAGIYIENEVDCACDPEEMARRVESAVGEILDARRVPVVLGGEHSVTIGAVRAAAARHPGVTVLQLDAHGDRRQSYHGSRFNHACVMARAAECAPILQVGIRSMDRSELAGLEAERIFYAHDIHASREWIPRLTKLLGKKVYITIDLDVFDPGILPATGTPQPGGLGWYQVLELLRAAASSSEVVGFDVVELCPDGSHASPMLAATLVYRMIAYIEENRGESSKKSQKFKY